MKKVTQYANLKRSPNWFKENKSGPTGDSDEAQSHNFNLTGKTPGHLGEQSENSTSSMASEELSSSSSSSCDADRDFADFGWRPSTSSPDLTVQNAPAAGQNQAQEPRDITVSELLVQLMKGGTYTHDGVLYRVKTSTEEQYMLFNITGQFSQVLVAPTVAQAVLVRHDSRPQEFREQGAQTEANAPQVSEFEQIESRPSAALTGEFHHLNYQTHENESMYGEGISQGNSEMQRPDRKESGHQAKSSNNLDIEMDRPKYWTDVKLQENLSGASGSVVSASRNRKKSIVINVSVKSNVPKAPSQKSCSQVVLPNKGMRTIIEDDTDSSASHNTSPAAISTRQACSVSQLEETKERSPAKSPKLDVATIERLFNETEGEENAQKRTNSRRNSSVHATSPKNIESQQNFSNAATNQLEFAMRRTGTIAGSPSISKESYQQLMREFKNVNEKLRLANSFKKAQLHIGFLFASPFCHIVNAPAGRNNYLIYPQLQFITEAKRIKAGAKESNNGISFKCAVATQTNFVQMLSKAPKIVHISCHGIPNAKTSQKGHKCEDGDYLLFEHEQIIGELLSEKSLKNLVSNVDRTELVFLAACDSEFAARIFLRKGARHVICIEDMKEVLDEAILTFTDTFYRAVFEGNSICDAFTIAQKLTTNLHSWQEAKIFKLMTSEDKHECLPIQFDQSKSFENQSDKILVKEIPAKVEHLVFREKEMSKLIQKVMEGHRLVFIFGLLGIGKSVIARNVLHFMKERKYFCGGIIFVSLNGTKSIEALCHSLCQILVKNLVSSEADRQFFEGLMDSKEQQISFCVNFFNLATEFKLKKVEKHMDRNLFQNERSKKFLVCLDNAEDLIEAKREEFKLVLKRLLNSCPYLQIIITSRKHLLKLDDECIDPDPMFIPPLKGTKPVELFLLKAEKHRSITTDEIVELIQMDKSFDLKAFSGGQLQNLLSPEATTKLKLLLRQRNKVIEALLKHDLFRQFAGNPLSISTLAACYANPMAKRKELKFLYQKMLEGQLDLKLEEDDKTCSSPVKPEKGNSISLQLALQSSVDLLSEQSREAESLLFFLSLLPTGITLAQLSAMWVGNVEESISIIQLYELLDGGFGEKYVVLPFVTDFLKETINNDDKGKFIQMMCIYYAKLLRRLFQIISVDSGILSGQTPHLMNQQSSFADLVNNQNRRNSFDFFLKQQLQESTGDDKPVLSESLDQIVNIENCLNHLMDMLVKDCSDSDSNSIRTEIFSESEKEKTVEGKIDGKVRKDPQVLIEASNTFEAVRVLPNRSISLKKLSQISEIDEEQHASIRKKFELDLKPTNPKTDPTVSSDHITIEKMKSITDKASSDSQSPKQRVRKMKSTVSIQKMTIRQEASDSSSSDSYLLGTVEESSHHYSNSNSSSSPKGTVAFKESDLKTFPGFQRQYNYSHSNSCRFTKDVVVEVQNEKHLFGRSFTRRDAKSFQRGNSISKYQQKIGKLERQNVLVGLGKKRSLMTVTTTDKGHLQKFQSSFTPSECFITYACAVMFLSCEYNFSLSICNLSFKTKFSSPIFKANILRFKALNLEQLAIKEPSTESSPALSATQNPRQKTLSDALICTHKALKLYKSMGAECEYGIALSCFQIGHLYDKYHSEISTDHRLVTNEHKTHANHLQLGTKSFSQSQPSSAESPLNSLRAVDYYKQAIMSFLEIKHAKGIQIATDALKRLAPSDKKYKAYLQRAHTLAANTNGFLLRKQGEAISLMTEIVTKEPYESHPKQQEILSKSKTIQAGRRDTSTTFNPNYSILDAQGDSDQSELSFELLDSENK